MTSTDDGPTRWQDLTPPMLRRVEPIPGLEVDSTNAYLFGAHKVKKIMGTRNAWQAEFEDYNDMMRFRQHLDEQETYSLLDYNNSYVLRWR